MQRMNQESKQADSSTPAKIEFSPFYISEKIKKYDANKGYLKQLYIYADVPDMIKLKQFHVSLADNMSKRPLSTSETYEFLTILMNEKIVGSISANDIFTEMKKDFGLELFENCKLLQEKDFLTKEKLLYILSHTNPVSYSAGILILLSAEAINTEENLKKISSTKDPKSQAEKIYSLYSVKNILTELKLYESYENVVAQHRDIVGLGNGLNTLDVSFRSQYAERVLRHDKPASLAAAINILCKSESINTKANHDLIQYAADPEDLAIKIDARVKLLKLIEEQQCINTQNNREIIVAHHDPASLLLGVEFLKLANLLDENNFTCVRQHVDPKSMSIALAILYYASLETPMQRARIEQEDNPAAVAFAIAVQKYVPILEKNPWAMIIIRLINYYANMDLKEYFTKLSNEFLASSINFSQNTHIASVHHSTTASAIRLQERYAGSYSLDVEFKQIKAWANKNLLENEHKLEESKIEMAQKTVLSLMETTQLDYIDPASKISNKRLLALVWHAMHDEAVLTAPFKEAEKQLIEMLYHVQRDSAIDQHGNDDQTKEAKVMCRSGVFNKLIESLKGMHPDVEIIFIALENAGWKLSAVVKEEIGCYLKEKKPDTQMLKAIKNDGVVVVWDSIREKVSDRIFEEFGSLFSGKDDPAFKKFMTAGVDVDVSRQVEPYLRLSEETKSQSPKAPGLFSIFSRNAAVEKKSQAHNTPVQSADKSAYQSPRAGQG